MAMALWYMVSLQKGGDVGDRQSSDEELGCA